MSRKSPLWLLVVVLSVPATMFGSTGAIGRSADHVDGEYLVQLRKDVDVETGARVAKKYGAKPMDYLNAFHVMLVSMTPAQAERLNRNPLVERVEENAKGVIAAYSPQTNVSNPPVPGHISSYWGLDRIDQVSGGASLDGSYSWAADGTGAQVYVVDTGVLPFLPEFGSRVRTPTDLPGQLAALTGEDHLDSHPCWELHLNDQGNYVREFTANAAHGTAVASIAAGDVTGVAKGAQIVDARGVDCAGHWTAYRIMKVLQWIFQDSQRTAGRAVINMSINGTNPISNHDLLASAVATASAPVASGGYNIPVVVSAGNQADNANNHPPADMNGAIVVGGLTRYDSAWSASNYGGQISVYAPAEYVESATSCMQDVASHPEYHCDAFLGGIAPGSTNDNPVRPVYRTELKDCNQPTTEFCASGTSFSAPFVSGVIARVLSWNQNHSWTDFKADFNTHATAWVYEPHTGYYPILHAWDF